VELVVLPVLLEYVTRAYSFEGQDRKGLVRAKQKLKGADATAGDEETRSNPSTSLKQFRKTPSLTHLMRIWVL